MYQIDTGAVPSAHPTSRSSGVFRRKPALGLVAIIRHFLDGVARRRDRRRAMLAHRSLGELSDHLLRDIGIEPDSRDRMSSLLHRPPS